MVASSATGPRIDPQMSQTSTSAHALATAIGTGLMMLICDGVTLGVTDTFPPGVNDNNSPHDPPPPHTSAAVNDNRPQYPTETRIKVLNLSDKDVVDIEKTTTTEVVASLHKDALDRQIHGVVDTILNRLASKKWGGSISAVVNARWQFSAINSSLKGAYGSVEKMPGKAINKKVAKEVVHWLRLRAAGSPSSVGDNVNYLNPYYSSKNSLESWGWDVVSQANATGMVFGAGRAVHFHGTAKNNHRPAPFAISLPEDMSDMLPPANDAGNKAGGGPKTPRKAADHSSVRAEVSGSPNGWSIFRNLLGFLFR
jgi:hypothetical protein